MSTDTRMMLLKALKEKLDAQQLAAMMNYIHPETVEDLLNMSAVLQMNRAPVGADMMTSSMTERNMLKSQLNELSPGFGNDIDRVEQYSRLKNLEMLNSLRSTVMNGASDEELYNLLKEIAQENANKTLAFPGM